MAERDDAAKLRADARRSLTRSGFTAVDIGGLLSGAAFDERNRWFALADDLLAEDSTPGTWLRDGLAFWITCLDGRAELQRRICEVIKRPAPNPKPKEGVTDEDGNIPCVLDSECESAGPFETRIPLNKFSTLKLTGRGMALEPHIRFSVLPDPKNTVLVGLVGLSDSPVLPPGHRTKRTMRVTLQWAGGSQDLIVEREAP